MATISKISSADQTIRIFDNFYNTKLVVNAGDYDVVYSYFKGISDNTQNAANFAAMLFRIAQESDINVLELLQLLKGQPNKLGVNKVICYYLNTFKSKASLYGVGSIPKPNEAVQRNVVL